MFFEKKCNGGDVPSQDILCLQTPQLSTMDTEIPQVVQASQKSEGEGVAGG